MEVNEKVCRSFKWTFATEFLSKLIVPVTGMVLARILSPSAFGVVASILVATSFAEIFADAGFQKYFVQHDFQSEESKKRCFITALITCCTVALFCETDCGASWGAGHIPGAAGGFAWNLAEFVQWDAGGNFS